MRVIFVNLHTNSFFVKSINRMITGRRAMPKHRYFLDALQDNGVEIINLVTKDGSTLPTDFLRKITRCFWIRKIEARYVLRKNSIIDVSSIKNINDIRKDDIVIYYPAFNIDPEHIQFKNIEKIDAIKIVDHVHFYGDSDTAKLIENSGIKYYLYEVDLNKYSGLYRKNYSWFKGGYIVRPFYYEERFVKKEPFIDRKTMAVAMGTHTVCDLKEYVDEYGTNSYQPHRKMILEQSSDYPNEIKSYISNYYDNTVKIYSSDFIFIKMKKKIHNFFADGQQKEYFSFDMVEKYNEYKMFICPEDINGSYGVGTLEGMACGCAMIGINSGIFEDMGMTAGTHYISYDGTMEDLIAQIRYYQQPENQTKLEKIANNGYALVRSKFSKEAVGREYVKSLRKIWAEVNERMV